jgi:hypothetical protein
VNAVPGPHGASRHGESASSGKHAVLSRVRYDSTSWVASAHQPPTPDKRNTLGHMPDSETWSNATFRAYNAGAEHWSQICLRCRYLRCFTEDGGPPLKSDSSESRRGTDLRVAARI